MNKFFKKAAAVSGILAMTVSFSASAFAAEFTDMPNNWTTSALENAVKNGLLYGEENADGKGMSIKPDDRITRAQMAAIIVRAFGANETADISSYTDVDKDAWYYKELSKAVAMNAFRGDGNKMNPQNNITFQECFTVISQVLQLQIYQKNTACLDKFSDKSDIASWAVPYAAAVVGSGFWDGIDGKILPTEYITRSQFAVLMDKTVKTYITEPGTYSDFEDGNVMVRCDDVIISGADINGDIIVGDGVSNKGFTLDNSKASRYMFIRGGGENVKMQNNAFVDRVILINPGITLSIDATSDAVSGGYTSHSSDRILITPALE